MHTPLDVDRATARRFLVRRHLLAPPRDLPPTIDSVRTVVARVGSLQFEVLADRIKSEYEIPVVFETAGLYTARWAEAENPLKLQSFISANESYMAEDHTGAPVFGGGYS